MIVGANLAIVYGATFITLAVASAASDYLEERNRLKKRDEEIKVERYRELQAPGFTVPNVVTHLLHDQHPLALQEGGPAFVCDACTKDGPFETPRYTCKIKDCNFILHTACGVFDQVSASWKTEKLEIPKSAHKHSILKFVQGSSAFTCSHCNNEGTSEDSRFAASSSGTEETTTSPGVPSALHGIGKVATAVAIQGLIAAVTGSPAS
ncbi:hypothetical protein Cgig2_002857 [Carnegiea gigantea]|uniref:DC1 domain-containing protein n=1 Tax=Carnegiea gigantea TaxID=171969 RepID=A0A9Q1KPH7_9CARY|nr:hypothetical protein Cgig2_002857 [Carnegiea gigantea]